MRYVSHLECSVCGARFSAEAPINLCPQDGRPLQMMIDLDRLKAERGADGWWNPRRRDLWRFGGLLPLDCDDPDDSPAGSSAWERDARPRLTYDHPLAAQGGFRLEVKDEGRHHAGFGANPTLSFKDRGMAMTVSMARALGLSRLAVPTQGNAGDSLAEYAVAAGSRRPSSCRRRPTCRCWARWPPTPSFTRETSTSNWSRARSSTAAAGCARTTCPAATSAWRRSRSPAGEPKGKKTLGLEMAEPAGDRLATRNWELPDVIVYPTGGGTGVVGMAKAFDELEALGLVGPDRPRMICVQSEATAPIVRALEAGETDITPLPPGQTIATGLNVAQNVGHINVLRILRETGGTAAGGL